MGVDLTSLKNRGKWASFNWTAWRFLLNTASEYGWIPKGTVLEVTDKNRSRKKKPSGAKLARHGAQDSKPVEEVRNLGRVVIA